VVEMKINLKQFLRSFWQLSEYIGRVTMEYSAIMSFVGKWMELESMFDKISQTQIPYFFLMWNLFQKKT
jgi:hypothetical protein